jgi:methylglutaconyl-CoA hydratase
MSETLVRVVEDRSVVRLTLNRPDKRNALSRELLAELAAALDQLKANPRARVAIIDAAGPAFCAGMDLVEMRETAGRPDARAIFDADTLAYRRVLERILDLHVPVVAVVQGPALAGGLGLVLACDLVIAADAAQFSLPEPARGITAAIVTPLLVYRLGPSAAAYLLFSGEAIDAARARELGLCHLVVPAERLDQARDELSRGILCGAPGAIAITKSVLRDCAARNLREQLESAAEVSARARESDEAREGLKAFLERRPPAWQVPHD